MPPLNTLAWILGAIMLIKNQTRRNLSCIQFKFSLRIKNKMWILSLLFLMGCKLYHIIIPYHYMLWVGCKTAKPWPKLTMELEGVHYYLFQIQKAKAVWNKSPAHTCLCLNTLVFSSESIQTHFSTNKREGINARSIKS